MSFKENAVIVLLSKSDNKLKAAQLSLNEELFDSVVSDLYYSAFQSVSALMVYRDLKTDKHTHVRAFVNKELGLKGLLPLDLCKMYGILMDQRSDADYSSEVSFTREIVHEIMINVVSFNKHLRELLQREGFNKLV